MGRVSRELSLWLLVHLDVHINLHSLLPLRGYVWPTNCKWEMQQYGQTAQKIKLSLCFSLFISDRNSYTLISDLITHCT